MDALRHMIHVLRLRPQLFYRSSLAAPWGMRFTLSNTAGLHLIEKGQCWLRMVGLSEPLRLSAGDIIVVSNTSTYELVDELQTASVPVPHLLQQRNPQGIISLTPGHMTASTIILCGELRPEQNVVYPLFSLLPPLVHIQNQGGEAVEWLTSSLRFMSSEAQAARPGYEIVISRMLDILFVMVMRSWIDQRPPGEGGWLGALYNPQMGEVLEHIHEQPEQQWTVKSLAQIAYMSRSTFAERFNTLVGEPPLKYLTRWRIQLAMTWLLDDESLTVERIAHRVGYTSAYAFSKAFKRAVGVAPRDYRQQRSSLEAELEIQSLN